ncbi:MAG TPA: AIR carboxylase family protein, partial [Bacteroidetes bacterium]|nr:AIR carboxylase family protein [Bacteroidota bacterium]
ALAAHTILPVIGVPMDSSSLNGLDALISTAQMPSGVPVATFAIGKAGAINSAVFCARIFSMTNPEIRTRLTRFRSSGSKLPNTK